MLLMMLGNYTHRPCRVTRYRVTSVFVTIFAVITAGGYPN